MRYIISAFLLSFLVACAPRGETKSLDEILNASKSRFRVAQQDAVKASGRDFESTSEQLSDIVTALESLESADLGEVSKASGAIVSGMNSLLPKTGYPTRPGIGELVKQFRDVQQRSEKGTKVELATLKLLSSRAYNALASELESTRFQIS